MSRRSVSDFLIRFKQTLSLRTFSLLFLATLSQNCTAGHGFRLDLDFFTRAGVRRYLNSNANKFYFIHTYVCATYIKRNEPCTVRSAPVCGPFNIRLTSVFT